MLCFVVLHFEESFSFRVVTQIWIPGRLCFNIRLSGTEMLLPSKTSAKELLKMNDTKQETKDAHVYCTSNGRPFDHYAYWFHRCSMHMETTAPRTQTIDLDIVRRCCICQNTAAYSKSLTRCYLQKLYAVDRMGVVRSTADFIASNSSRFRLIVRVCTI